MSSDIQIGATEDEGDLPVDPDWRLQLASHRPLNDRAGQRLDEYGAEIGDLKAAVEEVRARDVFYKTGPSGDPRAVGTGFTQRILQALDAEGWDVYTTRPDEDAPFETTTFNSDVCKVDRKMVANAVDPTRRVAVQLTFGNTSRIADDLGRLRRLFRADPNVDLGVFVTPTHRLARDHMSTKVSHDEKTVEVYEEHRRDFLGDIDAFTTANSDDVEYIGPPIVAAGVDFTSPLDPADGL